MNDIQIFNNPRFGEVRVAEMHNEPMFCLADVCRILDLRVDGVLPRLKEDGYNRIGVTDSLGRMQQAYFVNEKNLYRVVMRSDKEVAVLFQDWVCDEVLPSIRKTGMYATPDTVEKMIENPDFAIQLLQSLKEERTKRLAIEAERETARPKEIFADAVSGSSSSCLIGELAKILRQNGVEIGQNRLFKWMRDNGYLGKYGERFNIPNQQYIEQGLFELKQGVRSGNDGVMHTTITPKVTGKGQVYFINKFINN